jgi:hypothetical protein
MAKRKVPIGAPWQFRPPSVHLGPALGEVKVATIHYHPFGTHPKTSIVKFVVASGAKTPNFCCIVSFLGHCLDLDCAIFENFLEDYYLLYVCYAAHCSKILPERPR